MVLAAPAGNPCAAVWAVMPESKPGSAPAPPGGMRGEILKRQFRTLRLRQLRIYRLIGKLDLQMRKDTRISQLENREPLALQGAGRAGRGGR